MSTRSNGARSMCEYCLAAADQRRDAGHRVGDLAEQQLGLQRVGQPAHGPVEQLRRRARRRACRGTPVVVPAADEDRRELPGAGDAVLVEPVGELVLALGLLAAAVSSGADGDRLHRLLLHVDEQLEQPRVDLVVREHRQLVPHAGDPLAQRGGRAHRRRGRVVQLVRQAGRQRAEGEQLLALADDLLASCACPRNRPSSRWIAIGNHSRTASAKSSPRSTNSRASVTARDRGGVLLPARVARCRSASRRRRRRAGRCARSRRRPGRPAGSSRWCRRAAR